MERSSSTSPQTHKFFVPNIKGLAQKVLTWEGKKFAAADAEEMNWKHKVTPDRGDLIMTLDLSWIYMTLYGITKGQWVKVTLE